jgi:peptide/nickel transport system ATP-binding protein
VLDEALSAIDSSLRGDILRLLIELQQTRNTAYLFISHDLAMVRAVAHRVAIMDAGRIVEIGEARAVVDAPQSDIGQALVAAIPRLNTRKGSRND